MDRLDLKVPHRRAGTVVLGRLERRLRPWWWLFPVEFEENLIELSRFRQLEKAEIWASRTMNFCLKESEERPVLYKGSFCDRCPSSSLFD
jgi:hypothetical protein